MTEGTGPDERRIPFGVWAVAILSIVLWSLLLLDATGIRPSNSQTLLAQALGTNRFLDWFFGGVAVVGIAGAIALLRLRPIGFVVTVILAGFGLVNALASQVLGYGDDLRLGLVVLAVLYLNQPSVRAVFGRDDTADRTVTRGAEGE